jgi:hypothetical protein
MAAEKVSITVDHELLETVRRLANGNLSQWFTRAAEEKLQRELRRAIVEEDLETYGPVPEDIRQEVLRQWPSS